MERNVMSIEAWLQKCIDFSRDGEVWLSVDAVKEVIKYIEELKAEGRHEN